MKVTQEKLPASQVSLAIELPANITQAVYEQTLQTLSRQVRLSGFRPGKVPRKVLIQQLGPQRIKAQAVEALLEQNVPQAFSQEGIRPIGEYNVTPDFEGLVNAFEPNQPLNFSVVVDVTPEVALEDYKGLSVQAETVLFNTDRVDEVITHYSRQLSTLMPLEEERAAEEGDVAVVDYQGFLVLPQDAPEGTEPTPISDAQGKDAQLDLTEGSFIPGFVDGIIGMMPGESRDVSATFPEGYPVEDLAGKAAVFQVTLKELKVRELPELNDQFAQDISDYETYDALVEGLTTRYRREAEEEERNNKVEACISALVEKVQVDLPATLVKEQTQLLLREMISNLMSQGFDLNQVSSDVLVKVSESLRPNAIFELKKIFGLLELAKKEEILPTDEQLNDRMGLILSRLNQSKKKVDLNRLRALAQEELTQEASIEWLLENSTIEMVPPGTLSDDQPLDMEIDLTEEEPEASATDDEESEAIEATAEDAEADSEA